MAVTEYYPSNLTAEDGWIERRDNNGQTWANIHDGAGTTAGPNETQGVLELTADGVSNKWRVNTRFIFQFDTTLHSGGVKSAIVKIYVASKYVAPASGWAPSYCIVASTPASEADIVTADYSQLGSTPLSNVIAYADIVAAAYNTFTLTPAGIAAIVAGGITKLGLREYNYDVLNSAPTWGNQWTTNLTCNMLEHAAGDPILEITPTTPRTRAYIID